MIQNFEVLGQSSKISCLKNNPLYGILKMHFVALSNAYQAFVQPPSPL